eukprot:1190309-Prorocentrum_minimum.AAC.3
MLLLVYYAQVSSRHQLVGTRSNTREQGLSVPSRPSNTLLRRRPAADCSSSGEPSTPRANLDNLNIIGYRVTEMARQNGRVTGGKWAR